MHNALRGLVTLLSVSIVSMLVAVPFSGTDAALGPRIPCRNNFGPGEPNNASDLMRGRLRFVDQPVYRSSTRIPDWSVDPYENNSWLLWFHSLTWLEVLLKEYEQTGDSDYRDRALAIAHDFVSRNPYGHSLNGRVWSDHATALRTETLSCLANYSHAVWLRKGLLDHAKVLARDDFYSGPYNHGLDQSIALLLAGCRAGRPRLVALARSRMAAAIDIAVDEQGASNEQSLGYVYYNYQRWLRAAALLRKCGSDPPEDVQRRVPRMLTFLAHAIQPDGRLAQIGDTGWGGQPAPPLTPVEYSATRGARGAPPSNRVAVYQRGYVFGRSGWGDDGTGFDKATFYTLRFGPGREYHGHDDHMALTWSPRGRNVLVDSGFVGYDGEAYQRWTLSAAAHNTSSIAGYPFDATAATALTGYSIEPDQDSYSFSDRAYGVVRTRRVALTLDGSLAVVVDEIGSKPSLSPVEFQQTWHFDPSFRITKSDRLSTRLVDDDGTRVSLTQRRLDVGCALSTSVDAYRGSTSPIQGWVSRKLFQREPATALVTTQRGRRVKTLTVLHAGPGRVGIDCGHPTPVVSVGNQTFGLESRAGGLLRLVPQS